jgi:thiamine pyridinylase
MERTEQIEGRRKRKLLIVAGVILALLQGVTGWAEACRSLRVALYPYVPDQARFQRAIEAVWNVRHTGVKLDFVSWDCYQDDPPADLDVFVYDGILLHDFLEKGYLSPLAEEDIQDVDDFIPCAISACRVDGIAYALPQMLCTNLLFSRKDDAAISNVRNIYQLYQAIGSIGGDGIPPAEGEGLLLSLPSAISKAFWVLETWIDEEQAYSEWVTFPDAEALDGSIMSYLQMLRDMAGDGQLSYVSPDGNTYIRGAWFAQGRGRAFIGFSETMSDMGDAAEDMVFHRISLSDQQDIPMLYADIASVNARISDDRRPLAVELVNVITDAQAMVASLAAGEEGQNPQYLLSARSSVYDVLAKDYPIYGDLKEIASDPNCRVFIVRPGSRALVEQAEEMIPLL